MPNSITRHVVLATPTPGPGRQHHTSWRIQKNMTTNIIWMWPINIRMRIRMRTQNIRIRIRMRPPKHSHSHSNATTKHSHSHSNVSIQQGIRIRIRIRTKLRIRIRIRMRSYAFGYKPGCHLFLYKYILVYSDQIMYKLSLCCSLLTCLNVEFELVPFITMSFGNVGVGSSRKFAKS